MSSIYSNVIEKLSPKQQGNAAIVIDTPSDFERMRGAFEGMPLYREKYARLLVNGETMMTDCEFERRTNMEAVRKARGDALIAGLGIGLILDPFLSRCKTVTVIEKNQDVISLVEPAYRTPQLSVIHADIYEWVPIEGSKFDTIYFDIWGFVNGDVKEEGQKLMRRFRKYLHTDGWIGAWSVIALKQLPRRFR